jgi:hypothetical protein
MPLSERSRATLTTLSQEHGFSLLTLEDPYYPSPTNTPSDGIAGTDGFIERSGGFLHFPTTYILNYGKRCGHGIPGYKDPATFAELIAERAKDCVAPAQETPRPKRSTEPGYTLERKYRLPTHHYLYMYYFKAMGEQGFVASLGNYAIFRGFSSFFMRPLPGSYDHFPSPDLELLTVPGPLKFYDWNELRTSMRPRKVKPLFVDESIPDEYQSVGLLEKSDTHRKYRVVTSFKKVAAANDYTFDLKTKKIERAGERVILCGTMEYSTPVVSRNGRYLALRDNRDNHTKIFEIGEQGSECREVINTHLATGKVSFDHSDHRITYTVSTKNEASVHVLDIRTGEETLVTSATAPYRLFFPDFTPSGKILVMTAKGEFDDAKGVLVFMP